MDKRQFLKTSGALVSREGMLPLSRVHGDPQETARTNWAGNYTYRAPRLVYPTSVAEVQEIVKKQSRVKVLGTRHAF